LDPPHLPARPADRPDDLEDEVLEAFVGEGQHEIGLFFSGRGGNHPCAVSVTVGIDDNVKIQQLAHRPVLQVPEPSRQVIDTLKFAAAAADAMNAPVCALSCTPNSILISSGRSPVDRRRASRLRAAGATAAVASSNVFYPPAPQGPGDPSPGRASPGQRAPHRSRREHCRPARAEIRPDASPDPQPERLSPAR